MTQELSLQKYEPVNCCPSQSSTPPPESVKKEKYITPREQGIYRTTRRVETLDHSLYYIHLVQGTELETCSTALYKFQNYK